MKNMKKKRIPKFMNEDEEREFWASHDSTYYIDWSEAKEIIMPNLKPTLKTISIRLPEIMIEELKLLANKRDVPYQSLMKMFLSERVEQELNK
ncbi:MAG: BrnA antitoxin family protein [Thermodesulfobacteriota bacterium]|nr:BrnA antitoxin family protein [Thermodesulfobacteriota bacterium]